MKPHGLNITAIPTGGFIGERQQNKKKKEKIPTRNTIVFQINTKNRDKWHTGWERAANCHSASGAPFLTAIFSTIVV